MIYYCLGEWHSLSTSGCVLLFKLTTNARESSMKYSQQAMFSVLLGSNKLQCVRVDVVYDLKCVLESIVQHLCMSL